MQRNWAKIDSTFNYSSLQTLYITVVTSHFLCYWAGTWQGEQVKGRQIWEQERPSGWKVGKSTFTKHGPGTCAQQNSHFHSAHLQTSTSHTEIPCVRKSLPVWGISVWEILVRRWSLAFLVISNTKVLRGCSFYSHHWFTNCTAFTVYA